LFGNGNGKEMEIEFLKRWEGENFCLASVPKKQFPFPFHFLFGNYLEIAFLR
jgi:hypothetical protein